MRKHEVLVSIVLCIVCGIAIASLTYGISPPYFRENFSVKPDLSSGWTVTNSSTPGVNNYLLWVSGSLRAGNGSGIVSNHRYFQGDIQFTVLAGSTTLPNVAAWGIADPSTIAGTLNGVIFEAYDGSIMTRVGNGLSEEAAVAVATPDASSHTFEVRWYYTSPTTQSVKFLVDNNLYRTVTNNIPSDTNPIVFLNNDATPATVSLIAYAPEGIFAAPTTIFSPTTTSFTTTTTSNLTSIAISVTKTTTTSTSTSSTVTVTTGGATAIGYALSFSPYAFSQCGTRYQVVFTGPFTADSRAGHEIMFWFYQYSSGGGYSSSSPQSLMFKHSETYLTGDRIAWWVEPSDWNYISFSSLPYIYVKVEDDTVPSTSLPVTLYAQIRPDLSPATCGGTPPASVSNTYVTVFNTFTITNNQYVTVGSVQTITPAAVTLPASTTKVTKTSSITSYITNATQFRTLNLTTTSFKWINLNTTTVTTRTEVENRKIYDPQWDAYILGAVSLASLFGIYKIYSRRHPKLGEEKSKIPGKKLQEQPAEEPARDEKPAGAAKPPETTPPPEKPKTEEEHFRSITRFLLGEEGK